MLEWLHFVGEYYACQREKLYSKHILQIGKIVYEYIQIYYVDTSRPDDDVWVRDRDNHLKTIRQYLQTGNTLSPSKPFYQIKEGFERYLKSQNIESSPELESHFSTMLILLEIKIPSAKVQQDTQVQINY
jgi:hypothetical protein